MNSEIKIQNSPSALWASLRVHWVILRTALEERLVYRGDFMFATLVRFLPIVTQIFLWGAIYDVTTRGTEVRLNGYTYSEMVAYYLLTMLGRAFSSMPGLSRDLALEIREGTLKRYLTQPVDMLAFFFWSRVAHKLVYYLIATVPFAIVFVLCRSYFQHAPTTLEWAALFASLILAFLLGFLMEALVGLVGFWMLEINSLSFTFMMLSYFLSGHMLPIDWLPGPVAQVVGFLPFQYLAYFPSAILLGKFTPTGLGLHLLVAATWTLALWGLTRLVFRSGLRRYGAYGG